MTQERDLSRVCRVVLGLTLGFLASSVGMAQIGFGIAVTKTCPVVVEGGSTFQCTFTVENQDSEHGVVNLAVTSQVPFPDGPIGPAECLQDGAPVTALGLAGTSTDTCGGAVTETAPKCKSSDIQLVDRISAEGETVGTGNPVTGAATNAVLVPPCVHKPTKTPKPDKTPKPTKTPKP